MNTASTNFVTMLFSKKTKHANEIYLYNETYLYINIYETKMNTCSGRTDEIGNRIFKKMRRYNTIIQ